jgi:hypothetical protein
MLGEAGVLLAIADFPSPVYGLLGPQVVNES